MRRNKDARAEEKTTMRGNAQFSQRFALRPVGLCNLFVKKSKGDLESFLLLVYYGERRQVKNNEYVPCTYITSSKNMKNKILSLGTQTKRAFNQ